jgi:dienelactone hydrolase
MMSYKGISIAFATICLFLIVALLPALAGTNPLLQRAEGAQTLKEEIITYNHGDTVLEGYLVYEESVKDKRPGVIIIHEWMGLSEYEKMRARQIAELGYVAFAADIYGKGVRPKNADEAAQLAGKFRSDRNLLRERGQAALSVLQNHPLIDPERIATMGYCFGGGASLELARSGAPIRGAISFHGNLDTPNPDDAKNIKGSILVLHGADDPMVPMEQVIAFQEEMRSANVDWQMIFYGNTVHSFTNPKSGNNPESGVAYNPISERRSFEAMKAFFNEIFAK